LAKVPEVKGRTTALSYGFGGGTKNVFPFGLHEYNIYQLIDICKLILKRTAIWENREPVIDEGSTVSPEA
jgi:hypothetical protein